MKEANYRVSRITLVSIVLLAIACLTGFYVVHNFDFFFTDSSYIEIADFAKDALAITKAKSGNEIYGSFSRWGFYHPGPAYFYLYAASEYLFYDWTGLAASPQAAHTLGNTIFQISCVVAAVAYALRKLDFIAALPIALLILVIHWSYFSGAPYSTWPPHVMFGPVVLLIVSAAGLASGDKRLLPILIFAGGMLVHNHVAQPLLVAPVGGIGLAVWALNLSRSDGLSKARLEIIASAVIAAVFLAPFLIDSLRGSDSNIAAILRNLRAGADDHYRLGQSVGYFLSFFRYETTQFAVQGGSFSLVAYVALHWALFSSLVIAAAALAFLAIRSRHPFLLAYALFLTLSVVITIIWGMMQHGGMYEFNGNFNYAIIYLIYLLPILALSQLRIKLSERTGPALFVLGSIALAVLTPRFGKVAPLYAAKSVTFRSDLKQFMAGAPNAYIRVDPKNWIEAVAAVNMIDRLKIGFRLDSDRFALQKSRSMSTAADFAALEDRKTAIVSVVGGTPPGSLAIPSPSHPVSLVHTHLERLHRGVFSATDLSKQVYRNLFFGDGYAITGVISQILFMTEPSASDVTLSMQLFSLADGKRKTSQRVTVRLDGLPLGETDVSASKRVTFTIPQKLWSDPERHCLSILVPDAQSGINSGSSTDARRLGVGLKEISIE
jgi:hypothetical protein